MSGYTPLFSSIVASTIWRESKETKIVWITMLAMSNSKGIVEASLPGLADLARVTIPECESSILVLSSKDHYSRSENDDGRRIEKVDGGWRIINHEKFREKAKSRAEYMRTYRDQRPAAPKANKPQFDPETISFPPQCGEQLKAKFKEWMIKRHARGRCKDWTDLFNTQLAWLMRFAPATAIEIIDTSIRNGWTGLFEAKGKHAALPAPAPVDPDIRAYALQALEITKKGERLADFWFLMLEKFGPDKKAKIVKETNLLINNPKLVPGYKEEQI